MTDLQDEIWHKKSKEFDDRYYWIVSFGITTLDKYNEVKEWYLRYAGF